MSDKIWNNPLMWNTKKSSSNSQSNDFDDEFDFESDFDFEVFADDIKDAQKQFEQVDNLAQAGEYKETTPQAGQTANTVTDGLSNSLSNRKIDNTKPDYLLKAIFGNNQGNNVLPLKTLLGGDINLQSFAESYNNVQKTPNNINFFDDDKEDDIVLADKLGIKIDDIFDTGVAVGLSPFDIVDNLNVLRSSATLKHITAGKLSAQDLKQLYEASLNNDTQTGQSILNKNDIKLNDDISIQNIIALAQAGNNRIFKSVYLN
jgi:hypothetical protein